MRPPTDRRPQPPVRIRPRVLLATGVMVALLARPAAGQAWPEPVTVPWPMADLAVHGDSTGLLLLAMPGAITPQSDSSEYWLQLRVEPADAREWIARARQVLDSVAGSFGDLADRPLGVTLRLDEGRSVLTLGIDRNATHNQRYLLRFRPAPPQHAWTTLGGRDEARALLAAMEEVLQQPAPRVTRSGLEPPPCDGTRPRRRGHVDIDWPTTRFRGGQVLLHFVVDSAGRPVPESARVLLSTGPQFTEVVRRSFAKLRYTPATCDGRPVASSTTEVFGYFLSNRSFRRN